MVAKDKKVTNAYVSGVVNLKLAWEKNAQGHSQLCRFIDSFRPWFPSFHGSQGSARETVTAEIKRGAR